MSWYNGSLDINERDFLYKVLAGKQSDAAKSSGTGVTLVTSNESPSSYQDIDRKQSVTAGPMRSSESSLYGQEQEQPLQM